MALNDDNENDKNKAFSKHNSGTADLEAITDFFEEEEIKSKDLSNVRF